MSNCFAYLFLERTLLVLTVKEKTAVDVKKRETSPVLKTGMSADIFPKVMMYARLSEI